MLGMLEVGRRRGLTEDEMVGLIAYVDNVGSPKKKI